MEAGTHYSKHNHSHDVEKNDIKEGVHYKLMGIRDVCVVEMVEIGEQVAFKVLQE